MVAVVLNAMASLGSDLALVAALAITISVGIVALVAGWKLMTHLLGI